MVPYVSKGVHALQWASSMASAYVGYQSYYGKPIYGVDTNLFGQSKTIVSTAPSVETVLKSNGTSSKQFLKLTDADTILSASESDFTRKVRLDIGFPQTGTKMTKVVPESYVEGIINGTYKNVGGFVSVDNHSNSLKTLAEVYEGNRLDYANTPYNLETNPTYAKINFTLDHGGQLTIPFGEAESARYPFTGRGFTGSKTIVLPEYQLAAKHPFTEGDTIGIFDSKTGNMMKQYIYDGDKSIWLQSK